MPNPDQVFGPLYSILLILGLTLPTTRVQRLAVALLIVALGHHAFISVLTEPGLKSFKHAARAASIPGIMASVCCLLMLRGDPRATIRRYQNVSNSESSVGAAESGDTSSIIVFEAPASTLPFKERLMWAFGLTFNKRLIRTNLQVPYILPLPEHLVNSKSKFCLHQFIMGMTRLLRLVGIMYFVKTTPYLREACLVSDPALAQRVWNTILGMSSAYFLINVPYDFVSVLAVALGVTQPCDWPPLFGDLTQAYTLRRAWGRSWHQLLRSDVQPPGTALARLLGAQPGTLASRYIQLYTAFAISGWMHSAQDPFVHANSLPGDATVWNKLNLGLGGMYSAKFFILQAVGITFEDGVIALLKRVIPSEVSIPNDKKGLSKERDVPVFSGGATKMVGYIWVFMWFVLTYPPYSRHNNTLVY